MAEPSLSIMTDTVLAKSELLSFTQLCNELGIPNDMEFLLSAISDIEPHLASVHKEQANTLAFRSLWLSLKTKLYDTEDMLDNLDALRNILIKATQVKVGEVGHNGNLLRRLDDPAACGGRNRVDLVQRMRRTLMRPRENSESGGRRGSFVLKGMCLGLLLFAFVAFTLGFCAGFDVVG